MLVPINQKEFTNEDMHTLRSLTSPKKTATKDRLVNKTAQMLFSDDQIPEWPALRDRYLQRLEELSENVWGRDAGQEGPAQEKKDFIMLLMALRKVTRNIIRYYVQETKAYEQFPEALSTNPSWQRFVDYLYNIPTSLDWLDEEPFRSWSGLHTSLNPLLALNNIASDLSLHVGNNIHIIAQVIFASSQKSTEPEDDEDEATEEEDESMPYCKTLMDLFPVDLRYSAAEDEEFRMFSKILMKFYDDFDRYKASRGNQLTSSGNHRRSSLALLVSKGNSNKIDTRKMLLLREQQVKVHSGHFVQLRQFKKWKRRFRIFRGIKKMIRRRKRRIKRKVMEAFKKNIIKEKRLVNLHERYLEDLLHRVVDGWKDVVIW